MRLTSTLTNSEIQVRAHREKTNTMIDRGMIEIEVKMISLILITTNVMHMDLRVTIDVMDNIEVMHQMQDIDQMNLDLIEVIDVMAKDQVQIPEEEVEAGLNNLTIHLKHEDLRNISENHHHKDIDKEDTEEILTTKMI